MAAGSGLNGDSGLLHQVANGCFDVRSVSGHSSVAGFNGAGSYFNVIRQGQRDEYG
jgi:hypothetical protein